MSRMTAMISQWQRLFELANKIEDNPFLSL
jgi:hypothetical protein